MPIGLRSLRTGLRSRILLLALAFGATGYNCGAPPSIYISSPTSGAFHILSAYGPNITVDGQLNCLPTTGVEVRLWWDEVGPDSQAVLASVAPSTLFTATMPVPTDGKVLHTIIAEVRYGPALSLSRRHSVVVHVVDYTSNVGTGDDFTTLIRLTDLGLDEMEPALSAQASAAFDLNATLQWQDLLNGTEPCFVNGPFGSCFGRLHQALVTNASIGSVGVELDAVSGAVATDIALSDIDLNAQLQGKLAGFGFTCDAALNTDEADLDVEMDLEKDPADPSRLIVVQNGNVGVGPLNFLALDLNCSGVIGGVLGNLFDTVTDSPETLERVQTGLADMINSNLVLADGFQDALDEIALADAIGTSLGMDLGVTLGGDPLINGTGISVVAGIDPQPTTTECSPGNPLAGNGWACQALPDTVFLANSGGNFWGWDDTAPSGPSYDVGVGIEDTALNLLLRAVAEQGKLSRRVTSLPGIPGNLTWDALISPAGCAAIGMPCSDRVDIKISPVVAPLVRGNAGIGGSITDLVFQLNLEFATPGFNASYDVPRLTMLLTVEAGLDLVVANDELGFEFKLCDPEPCTPNFDLNAIYTFFPNVSIGPRLIDGVFIGQPDIQDAVTDLLTTSLASAIQGFPLPEFQGQTLTPITIEREGTLSTTTGYMTVFGDL